MIYILRKLERLHSKYLNTNKIIRLSGLIQEKYTKIKTFFPGSKNMYLIHISTSFRVMILSTCRIPNSATPTQPPGPVHRDKGEHSPAGPHSLGAQHPLLPEPRGVKAPRPLLPQTQESRFPGFPHIHEAGPPFPFPWIRDSKSSASSHLKTQESKPPALSHLRFHSWALSVLPGPAGPQGPLWGRNA